MKYIRNISYSFVSSVVATAITFVFMLGITGILSGKPGFYNVLETEELHRLPGNDFEFIDGLKYNLGYKTSGSYLYSKLGMGIKNDGYVLIPSDSTESYIEVGTEELDIIRKLGLLTNFPSNPEIGWFVWFKGNLLTILFVLYIISLGYLVIWAISNEAIKKSNEIDKKKKLDSILSGAEPMDKNSPGTIYKDEFRAKIILSLCYAAKADRKIEDEEINTILSIVENVTSLPVTKEEILEICELISNDNSDDELAKISKGVDDAQKWTIMRACILLSVVDSNLDRSELEFIFKIGLKFGFSEKEIYEKFKVMGLTNDE